MADIIISKKNESFLNLDCETSILYDLKERFTFEVPGAKFQPKVKAGLWDGRICLLDVRFGTLPIGLKDELYEFAEKCGYTIEEIDSPYGHPSDKDTASYEEVKTFVNSLKIAKLNKDLVAEEIQIRQYQIDAIYNCIHNMKQISISPTGSGKSCIAYCLFRWYHDKRDIEHFLLVVPTLGLIKQMYSDFKEYSLLNGFDVAANIQIIADGEKKILKKPLALCTWQSIYKLPSHWYQKVGAILGDEAHQYQAAACRNIFERATDTKYKFGITGSLSNSKVHGLVLKGLLGPISKEKTTRELIDEGFLSDIKINCIMLKYCKNSKKLSKEFDYHQEIKFIENHEKRNDFIMKLALSLKGNSLIIFNHIEHGELLYDLIKKNATDQKVYYISGKVDSDDRESIRKLVQSTEGDSITLGSGGTVSTGVNIPRLHNIIFASPNKSTIRVMQSIGRGLRKSDCKDFLRLFDIVDCINTSKTSSNFTFRHFAERLRIYVEEDHPYKLIDFELEK